MSLQATIVKITLCLTGLCLLHGCTIKPQALTTNAVEARVKSDISKLANSHQAITGPISLNEAMARALAHNLDLNLERYQTDLIKTELNLARHDQLPEFVAGHVADGRSNFAGGSSQSLITGRQSLESSTSSERYTKTDDLRLGWDVLNFGVSYIRAKQAADRVLVAKEQQQQVVNQILTDVQKAYFRAVSYQRLIGELETLMERVQRKLNDSKQIESRGLDTPLTALVYQRELINNSRELYRLYEGLTQAKVELAFLMNVPASADFELIDHAKPTEPAELPFNVAEMETLALISRSELREIDYQQRINAGEIKANYLGMLPGINLDYADNYDSNRFLFNSDWSGYSARISWNLLELFKIPTTRRRSATQQDIIEAQRLALSAAILTQVHIGIARHQHAATEYAIAADLRSTQNKITLQINRAFDAESVSEQELIREEMNALLAEVRYDIAFANLAGAQADIYFAMGLNPVLETLDASSLETLTNSIARYVLERRKAIIDTDQ